MGKQIKELTARISVAGTDKLPMQGANDLNYYGNVAQIGGYAVPGTCDTIGATQQKEVTLTNYTDTAIPSVIAVVFTHANEYGDTTASPATFPKLVIKNDASSPATIATLDVCDSRGHPAGTGCWNDGDRMEFAIVMTTASTGKAIIKNSDVRQKDTNLTIKSDGSSVYPYLFKEVTTTLTYSQWIEQNWDSIPAYPCSIKITSNGVMFLNVFKSYSGYGFVEGFSYSANTPIYGRKYNGTWYWN